MLQQSQFPEETAGKGLDEILDGLIPFSLLKEGSVGHTPLLGMPLQYVNKHSEIHTLSGQNMILKAFNT